MKHLFVWLCIIGLGVSAPWAWAVTPGGVPRPTIGGIVPKRAVMSPLTGVNALIRNPRVTPLTAPFVIRATLAAARHNFTKVPSMVEQVGRSVVQVALPQHSTVLGTGFVLKEHDRLWVVMPYHLAGAAGKTRVIRMRTQDGRLLEKEVTIALNGTAGWHEPDLSLAALPEDWHREAQPLEMAPARPQQDVYSLGYVAGDLGMQDMLPVASRFLYVDRENMLRQFHVPGSTVYNPISGNGYCGSPLLQQIDGEWKVVGMHNGHAMDLTNPAASIGSSVNLTAKLPQLIDNYLHPMAMGRGLAFRGWEVTRLSEWERVESIEVVPSDYVRRPTSLYLSNFTGPYSDSHVEEALGDIDLRAGDELVFYIVGRPNLQKRTQRQVVFKIP